MIGRLAGPGVLRLGARPGMVAKQLRNACCSMASITIRNLPPKLHEQLKTAARRHHRSLQNEIVACLTRYVEALPRPKTELMAEAAELRTRLPWVDHALVDDYKRAGRG